MQACCGHFSTLFPPFSSISTISLLVSFIKSKRILGWKPSHSTPVLSLHNLEAFSKSNSFSLGKASSNFHQFLMFPRLVLQILHALITLPMLCPLFPLCFTTVQQRCIFFSFLQDLCSSSPYCRLGASVPESSISLHTLNHLRHLLLMHFLQFFFSSTFFFSFSNHSNATSARYLPILDGSTLSHNLPPTSQ